MRAFALVFVVTCGLAAVANSQAPSPALEALKNLTNEAKSGLYAALAHAMTDC